MLSRIAICVGLILVLVSCDASSVRTEIDPSKITYLRDSRTDICFAVIGRGARVVALSADSFSMAAVPCSEKVMAQIKR